MKKKNVSVTLTEELHEAAYLRARFLLSGCLDHGIVAKYIRQLIRADVAKGREEGLLLANGTDGELLEALTNNPGNILKFPTS
jgi:hypothetical protein